MIVEPVKQVNVDGICSISYGSCAVFYASCSIDPGPDKEMWDVLIKSNWENRIRICFKAVKKDFPDVNKGDIEILDHRRFGKTAYCGNAKIKFKPTGSIPEDFVHIVVNNKEKKSKCPECGCRF